MNDSICNSNQSNILRLKSSAEHLSISLTTLWRLGETDPDFPPKIRLTSRCCGYFKSDLDAYLAVKRGA